jgi:hypothetical protein
VAVGAAVSAPYYGHGRPDRSLFVPNPSTGARCQGVACLASGVVSIVVHQRPWLVVVEVTHLVTRHQPARQISQYETPESLCDRLL